MKEEFVFNSSTGKEVSARKWKQAEEGEYKAVVQLVHGMQEHIDCYDRFAKFLVSKGYLVVGHDHLGHGKTAKKEEEIGFFASSNGWNHLAEDVHLLQNIVKKQYPNIPYFIMGHSMGSLVVRTYLTQYQDQIDGVILQGTSGQKYGLHSGVVLIETMKLFYGEKYRSDFVQGLIVGGFNRKIKGAKTESDWISRDEETVQNYLADPLCGKNFTLQAFEDLLKGSIYLSKQENINKTQKVPILMISGDKDPVGGNAKGVLRAYEMLRKSGNEKVRIRLMKEARHDLLNETNREEVYEIIEKWLEENIKKEGENK